MDKWGPGVELKLHQFRLGPRLGDVACLLHSHYSLFEGGCARDTQLLEILKRIQ